MKRDMDLIRDLLLHAESQSDGMTYATVSADQFDRAHSTVQLTSHIRFLHEEGLVHDLTTADGTLRIGELTSHGHDFVNLVRNDAVWDSVRQTAEQAGGWTFHLLTDLAESVIKARIKNETGLEF